jgi:hypothetical protein
MILREIRNQSFDTFRADVRIKHKFYSQIVPVIISAKNAQEAKKLLQAQYGASAVVMGIRKQ